MPRQRFTQKSQRLARRFLPCGWQANLEKRTLLSTAPLQAAPAAALQSIIPSRRSQASSLARAHASRVTPIAAINAQYAAFVADFVQVQDAYIESLSSSATNTTTVTATLTVPYVANSVLMQVDDATVFGPNGTFTTPLTATASFGGIVVGSFILTGRQGNTLTVDPTGSSPVNLNAGVTLSAQVQNTGQTSAAAIFPSFIVNRSQLMAINLVNYFNNLPLKLPTFNAPPHTPTQRGAIQSYVYQQVAGSIATSLQQSLLATPLPTTPTSDLMIYNAAIASAIEQSRQQVIGGVRQIFAGRLRINAPAPANRLGVDATSGTGATSITGSSSSDTSSSSSSTSSGTTTN